MVISSLSIEMFKNFIWPSKEEEKGMTKAKKDRFSSQIIRIFFSS